MSSTILEGSVRKSGLKLRITAQLINVEDGYHLWSETYDRELTDVFAIQDEITAAIVSALKVHLTPQDISPNKQVTSIDGYTAYMKGRHELRKRTAKGLYAAADFFIQSIEIDPEYAKALSAYARTLSLLPLYTNLEYPSKKAVPKARELANKSLAIDPQNSEAYSVLGHIIAFYDFDWSKAQKLLEQSIKLSPNDSEVYNFIGEF